MASNVHTAYTDIVNTDRTGAIVNKDDATISQVMNNITGVRRVFQEQTDSAPNAGASKKTGQTPPTIHDYLAAEAADGYSLVHMDQYYIITEQLIP